MDVPRRGTLLRSDQYDNCAKRHSVSSSEAKPWALCLTRMRVNAQEEKRKHGITCNTSRPLEKGRAKGAGWMCLEEAPLLRSDQYAKCAKRYSISSSEAKSRDLCRARMRRNEQAENESTILHMIRVAPWRRESRRGTSEFGFIQRGA